MTNSSKSGDFGALFLAQKPLNEFALDVFFRRQVTKTGPPKKSLVATQYGGVHLFIVMMQLAATITGHYTGFWYRMGTYWLHVSIIVNAIKSINICRSRGGRDKK